MLCGVEGVSQGPSSPAGSTDLAFTYPCSIYIPNLGSSTEEAGGQLRLLRLPLHLALLATLPLVSSSIKEQEQFVLRSLDGETIPFSTSLIQLTFIQCCFMEGK